MVTELTQTEIENWVMPRPARGESVLWYPDGDKNKEPEIAFVKEVSKRSIVANINGVAWDTIRHIDDPKLKLNEYQRTNGGWDFISKNNEEFDDLKKRVEALERAVSLLAPQKAAPKRKNDDDIPM